nr:hypothetical protein [Achromobacter ruhlandii]
MSSLSEALRQVRLPDERNQELLVAAADALDRAEAASVRDHQNTMHMIQSLTDLFREEKAAWQVERAAHDKAMGEVIRERNECRAMLDRQERGGEVDVDRLMAAAKGMTRLYSYVWDRTDGCLVVFPENVRAFDEAFDALRMATGEAVDDATQAEQGEPDE